MSRRQTAEHGTLIACESFASGDLASVRRRRRAWSILALVGLLLLPAVAAADPPKGEDPEADPPTAATGEAEAEQALLEERVRVVGSPGKVEEVTGSAHFLDKEELERQGYSDVQRLLRKVPGVYLQDEEGYGLRPNIGMRGSGVERSQKVTLMEDGVLIAPAPYAAPSAYYFPTAGRMESVEVSKGPSSIRQGPQTNGGALNLLSSSIPTRLSGKAEIAFGEDDHVRAKALVGDSRDRFGWLLESYRQETDGFKRLDGGGGTGFDLEDYVAKLRLNSRPGSRFYQSVELKLGTTEQLGNETYLGLTQQDFESSPYRRYVASGEDFILTDHQQAQLRYFVVPGPTLDLTTTLYFNDFFRNWHKLEKVNGVGVSTVLADPEANTDELAILRGEADSEPGSLSIRNNRRDYFSRGVQSVVGLRRNTAKANHSVEVGIRLHEDEEDRFQEEDGYQMLDGELALTGLGEPGSQSNRVSRARAMALFVRDRISLGRWTLTPGVRYENIDYTRTDYGKTDPQRTGTDLTVRSNDVSEVIPGIGVDYRLGPEWRIFGGVHRGFAPPGPGQNEEVQPEESVNYEVGVRFNRGETRLQAVAFYNDYHNLLGSDTVSSGGTGSGDMFNGGTARVTGLEASLTHDFASGADRGVSIPFRAAYTYSTGEFLSSFETSFADWAPAVERGDELPYVPPHQLFAEIGLRKPRWGFSINSSYVDEMRTKAGQGAIAEEESIESHLLFDASAEYSIRSHYRVFVQIRNLTDEVYVAARRPAGLRPGLPRTVLTGFGVRF